MRMPFSEFITGGDPKFLIVITGLLIFAIFQLFQKLKHRNEPEKQIIHNVKINRVASWVLILGAFSLLLGFMHSFYFIGQAGGIAPNLLYQGVSKILVTPVFAIGVYIICKLMTISFKPAINKS